MASREQIFRNFFSKIRANKSDHRKLHTALREVSKEVTLVLVPAPSTSLVNRRHVDSKSCELIPSAYKSDFVAINTTSDGNCLYNALSILLVNTEVMAAELRLRCVLNIFLLLHSFRQDQVKHQQLTTHMQQYLPYSGHVYSINTNNITSSDIEDFLLTELMLTIEDNTWSSMTQIQCLANATGYPILSVYPDANTSIRDKFDILVQPWCNLNEVTFILPILWSGFHEDNGWYRANHFVPLLDVQRIQIPNSLLPSADELTCKSQTKSMYRVKSDIHLMAELKTSSTGVCVNQQISTSVHSMPSETGQLPHTHDAESTHKRHRASDDCNNMHMFQCLKNLPQHYCIDCQQLILQKKLSKQLEPRCSMCFRYHNRQEVSPKHTRNLYPGDIPSELVSLTDTEIHMLSQAHPYIKLMKLPSGGQFAQSGQCINFPVNIQEVCSVLPRLPAHDHTVLVYNARQNNKPSIVNINNMQTGLQWLVYNNRHYANVSVHNILPQTYQGNQHTDNIEQPQHDQCQPPLLTQHPCNSQALNYTCPNMNSDSVYKSITTNTNSQVKPTMDIYSDTEGISQQFPQHMASNNMSQVVPTTDDSTEQCMPEVSLIPSDYILPDTKTISCALPWMTGKPINIFADQTAEELCFPKLFPYGTHSYCSTNTNCLTRKQYFSCRLLNRDKRWATCPSYLFWALYVYEQHSLQSHINIAVRLRNPTENLTAIDILQDNYKNIVSDDYRFMKYMKGTAAYWRDQLHDLMAKIRMLGPPTFFLSLSSNDMAWLEMYKFIDPDLPDTILPTLTSSTKTEMIRRNPVKASLYFSKRWEEYLHSVLLPDTSPLGTVVDHFARIEFQNRGSPHVHAFFWIANSPNMETLAGRQQAAKFIDSFMSAALPEPSDPMHPIVSSLQVHHHTFTCRRTKTSTSCRFDFPRPVTPTTTVCLTNISSTTGRFYELQRDALSQWVNPYNEHILKTWFANMDIQIVGSKYAAAAYICTYVCKNEPNSLKSAISDAIKKLPEYASNRKRLSNIGNVLLTHRVISAQEASFRLLNLPMVYSSRTTIYIPSTPPHKQYKLLKPRKAIESLSEDSTDVYVSGMHEKYTRRPAKARFNNMSLVKFATYHSFSNKKFKTSTRATTSYLRSYQLQGDPPTWIRERTTAACFRSYIPNIAKDREGHFYSLLCLFLPWRQTHDILCPHNTYEEAYLAKQSLLDHDSIARFHYSEQLLASIQQIRQLTTDVQTDIHCTITPAHMSQELDDVLKGSENVDNLFCFTDTSVDVSDTSRTDKYNSEDFKALAVYKMTEKEYSQRMNNLSPDQRQVITYIDTQSNGNTPIRIFISGGAGTGKSYLLQTLHEHLLRSSTSDYPNVVVAAPTGVAAYNVNGWTLHSLLNLDVQHKNKAHYTPLRGKTLAKLRELFKSVRYLIIDEVSMVSINTFIHVHKRLCEIKNTTNEASSYFGNLHIITFGDLYQLKPVCGSYIFHSHEDLQLCHIWKDLFQFHQLETNYRQKDDSTYLDILNRARLGKLNCADIALLNTRKTSNATVPQKYQRIYPLKTLCAAYNDQQTQQLTSEIHNIAAQDDPITTSISDDDSNCGGLPKTLHLAIGTRVMLLRNIETRTGLVNGAQGTVTDFQWLHDNITKDSEIPRAVLVLFDNPNVGAVFDENEHTPIAITPVSVTFYDSNKNTITRTQFPLCVSYAVTVHKIQGVTLHNAAIDIGASVFTAGMAYVALSRVSSLAGLHLLDFAPAKVYSSDKVHEEMERLLKERLIYT